MFQAGGQGKPEPETCREGCKWHLVFPSCQRRGWLVSWADSESARKINAECPLQELRGACSGAA
eukprot:4032861-Alexandrium_andersonii.AAC.1